MARVTQPVTSPSEWRRRAQQAGLAEAADAALPLPERNEMDRLVAQGWAELDADAACRLVALVNEQPTDVAGVRVGDGEVVHAHAGQQQFDTLGRAVAFLGAYFEATGDDDALAAAVELHDLTCALGDDVWHSPENAPVGYGAATLYGITGEQAFLATVERIADLLCETQSSAGDWGDDAVTAAAAATLAWSADQVESRAAAEAQLPDADADA